MSRYSGKQYKGASRALKQRRRKEAEARQEAHNLRMAVFAVRDLGEELEKTNDEGVKNAE